MSMAKSGKEWDTIADKEGGQTAKCDEKRLYSMLHGMLHAKKCFQLHSFLKTYHDGT